MKHQKILLLLSTLFLIGCSDKENITSTFNSSYSSISSTNNSIDENISSTQSSLDDSSVIKDITPSTTEISLFIGEEKNLNDLISFEFSPSSITNKNIIWSCQNDGIISIKNENTVVAHKEGQSSITATSASNKDISCHIDVNVLNSQSETITLTLNYESIDLKVNAQCELIATIAPENYASSLSWSISEGNAFISMTTTNNTASIKGLKKGISKVKVSYNEKLFKECLINVLEDNNQVANTCKYNIKYDLGTGTSSKPIENTDDLLKMFEPIQPEKNIISSISYLEVIYGGGYGGKNDTKWYGGDMLKLGNTSKKGGFTMELTQNVKSLIITGYIHNSGCKIRVGDSGSSIWETSQDDQKTTQMTCTNMNVVSKEIVDNKNTSTMEISFPSSKSIRIATLTANPLYITALEFILDTDYSSKTYTVTWKDNNGDILEIDENVIEGSMPSFDGQIPSKEGHTFIGWSPSIQSVDSDITYIALYADNNNISVPSNIEPLISEDKKTLTYGYYPQTHVKDENIIATLNTYPQSLINNWYFYNGDYYCKKVAEVYNNESYSFNDGEKIINGQEYWFKCEPIKWNILHDENNQLLLLSSILLDSHNYFSNYEKRMENEQVIYANNYEHSDIRQWLNTDFFNTAFIFNNQYIEEQVIDNQLSSDTLENPYLCNNTTDKVFLPSYQDCFNSTYGFDSVTGSSSITRVCQTTDYARCSRAWVNTGNKDSSLINNGTYWTRSPSSEYYYCAWNVNSSGFLSNYAIDGESHCVRPCISISLSKI